MLRIKEAPAPSTSPSMAATWAALAEASALPPAAWCRALAHAFAARRGRWAAATAAYAGAWARSEEKLLFECERRGGARF
jgi:hypothetical protein